MIGTDGQGRDFIFFGGRDVMEFFFLEIGMVFWTEDFKWTTKREQQSNKSNFFARRWEVYENIGSVSRQIFYFVGFISLGRVGEMDFNRMTWGDFFVGHLPDGLLWFLGKAGAMALYGTTISGGSRWDLEMARRAKDLIIGKNPNGNMILLEIVWHTSWKEIKIEPSWNMSSCSRS